MRQFYTWMGFGVVVSGVSRDLAELCGQTISIVKSGVLTKLQAPAGFHGRQMSLSVNQEEHDGA
jgi:hypothetical protein